MQCYKSRKQLKAVLCSDKINKYAFSTGYNAPLLLHSRRHHIKIVCLCAYVCEGIKPSGCLSIKCEYEINISGFLSGITLN